MGFITHIIDSLRALSRPFPMRDWSLIVAFAWFVAVALIGIAVYFFIGIQSGAIIVPHAEPSAPGVSVSREGLKKTLETYDTRKLNFDSGNIKAPDVSDPSR